MSLDDPQRALYGCHDPAFIITLAEIHQEIDANFVLPAMHPAELILLVDGCIVIGNPTTGLFRSQAGSLEWTTCEWFEKEFAAGKRPILKGDF